MHSSNAKAGVVAKTSPAKISPAKIFAREISKPAPAAFRFLKSCYNQYGPANVRDVTESEHPWPDRRELPKLPDGDITQEIGEKYCKQLCNVYHEVFDGGKGTFRGAEAIMNLKPGGLEEIKRSGPRPVEKYPLV